ncbi:MAG: N-6 DNA methylase [Acidimicrobiales bacterium]
MGSHRGQLTGPDPSQRWLDQRRWAEHLVRTGIGGTEPLALAAAVADRVADTLGVAGPSGQARSGPTAELPAPPEGWRDPWLLGLVHEQAVSADDRRRRGAWYTPRAVVDGLLDLVARSGAADPGVLLDPTCGGGAFLLSGLDRLVAGGVAPAEALSRVVGVDLDPGAAAVTRWSLGLWGAAHGVAAADVEADVICGDVLASDVAARIRDRLRAGSAGAGPALIVGNPPFASPLRRGALTPTAAAVRAGHRDLLGPYAGLGAIHLLHTVGLAPAGATVALVQPLSVVASRDTGELRRHLDRVAPVRALWAAREPVFDAGVRACAPILVVGGRSRNRTVTLAAGPGVVTVRDVDPGPWGDLAADALGAPSLPEPIGRHGGLGARVVATAGFRDEHYALVAACRDAGPDDGDTPRLITVGSVEPLSVRWATGTTRFGGRDRVRPVIDAEAVDERVRPWFDRQLRPKILLATQTPVLEPVVDRIGNLVPATPVVAVHADPDELNRVAAVLLAPPVVLWAWRRSLGTGMTAEAIKLAARQVPDLPLPPPEGEQWWAKAADEVGHADGLDPGDALVVARRVADLMNEAYGAGPDVLAWWQERLDNRRRRRPASGAAESAPGRAGNPGSGRG